MAEYRKALPPPPAIRTVRCHSPGRRVRGGGSASTQRSNAATRRAPIALAKDPLHKLCAPILEVVTCVETPLASLSKVRATQRQLAPLQAAVWPDSRARTVPPNFPQREQEASAPLHEYSIADHGILKVTQRRASLGVKDRWVNFDSFSDGVVWDPLRRNSATVSCSDWQCSSRGRTRFSSGEKSCLVR